MVQTMRLAAPVLVKAAIPRKAAPPLRLPEDSVVSEEVLQRAIA
jgi:hypothetical protein